MEEQEMVVLVDEEDSEVGTMEKLQAHVEGRLHRALSVFLFNGRGQMLLQRRALSKYHSGGLWTNTCCSHPRPGEDPLDASQRRLGEEMGVESELGKIFDFVYRAHLDKGLVEHEFDHVFVGAFHGEPVLNPAEAMDWRWADAEEIERDVEQHPENYTAWFKMIFKRVFAQRSLPDQPSLVRNVEK
jgi:isopentenyl-diphosphate delta-isomerase